MLSATVDFDDALRSMGNMEDAAKRLRPAWASLRRPMRDDQRDHAKAQAGPNGKWPRNSPKTIERARQMKRGRRKAKKRAKGRRKETVKFTNKRGRRQFRASRLLGSLPNRTVQVQQLGGDGLRAFSRVPWSGVHQEGGRAGRGSRIPARPFLWLSSKFRDLVVSTLEDHIVEAG